MACLSPAVKKKYRTILRVVSSEKQGKCVAHPCQSGKICNLSEGTHRDSPMRALILTLLLFVALPGLLPGATSIIKDDKKGVVVFKQKNHLERLDHPLYFEKLMPEEVYQDAIGPGGTAVRVQSDLIVKVVYFLNPTTFPTKFDPEDLAIIKAKIDELQALGDLSQEAGKLAAAHLKFLQNIYDTESARYKQSAAVAAQKFKSEQEKADFDKKCELMRLDLLAAKDDVKKSEEIVKQMEPLAPQSAMLTDLLATWNQERNRALQLSSEFQKLWTEANKSHPECFRNVSKVSEVPEFPAEMKGAIADLETQMEQFRGAVTFQQIPLYCHDETPALFLLNELPKLGERIRSMQYSEAVGLAEKALHQVREQQFLPAYAPIYQTFKNYSDTVADLRSRFYHQLSVAKLAEADHTNRELLIEYQKAYDIIPDPAVAAKIEELKAKIQSQ